MDFGVFCPCRMTRGSCSCWQGQQRRASWRGNWPASSSGSGTMAEFRHASVAPGSTSSTTLQHSEFVLRSGGVQESACTDKLCPPTATWTTWREYPMGRTFPPSRTCWGPESKLPELWKHTLLSRIFTSSNNNCIQLLAVVSSFEMAICKSEFLFCRFSECLMLVDRDQRGRSGSTASKESLPSFSAWLSVTTTWCWPKMKRW